MFSNISKNNLKQLFKVENAFPPRSNSQRMGILYQKGTQNSIPLKSISYLIEIIDSLAFISLTQEYINSSINSIETEFFFSVSDHACFYGFEAEIDEQIMIGQVKEKQEAKAEYEQNKAQGNIVAYSEINKEVQDIMKINIGNVPPNKLIKIKYSFLQELDVCLNKFWKLLIPATLTPRYNSNTNVNENLLDLQDYQNFAFPQVKQGYEWTIIVNINSMTEISFIRSPSHEINVISLDNFRTKFQVQFKKNEIPNKDFTLLFRNFSLNQTKVSLAQNKEEENPFCAMINFMPNFNPSSDEDAYQAFLQNSAKTNYEVNLMNAKGEYIFLLDRSGSMSGKRIKMATDALKLFIKSLPSDSYFNIIGFGSTFQMCLPASSKTSENLIRKTLDMIENTGADLGGTEIYKPLLEALKSQKISQYPKNIFILTDGDVSNVSSILSLINENNDLSRVYTIGVGNGCSREIIVEGAKLGKGKHEFIAENEDMNEKIIGLLEDSITPFLSDFKMTYDINLINIIAPLPESINFIRKNEEFKVFAFLNKNLMLTKQTVLKIQYFDSFLKKNVSMEIPIYLNDLLINNDYLHKYGAFQVIKRIQRNLIYERIYDSDIYLAKKDDLESYCLNFALKYQIITPFTSFICVIKPRKNESFFQPEKIVIPSIESQDYQKNKIEFFGRGIAYASNQPQMQMNSFSQNSLFAGLPSSNSNNQRFQTDMNCLGYCGSILQSDKKKKKKDNINLFDCCETLKKESTLSTSSISIQMPTHQNTFLNTNFQSVKQENLMPDNALNKESWLVLLEKQKFEGYWEMNEENSILLGKNLSKVANSMPKMYAQGNNDAGSLWMTCLILFFFEYFHKEKIGSWRLICKKAEQWMDSKGFKYQLLKETAKIFYYGFCMKSQNSIILQKNCKCGNPLNFVKSIPVYQGNYFGCDICSATNLIDAGVFHCESCKFDLCEECNNEQIICCGLCQGALKWMTTILQPEYKGIYYCDICTKQNEIKNGVYHCSSCGKFDLCLDCKSMR